MVQPDRCLIPTGPPPAGRVSNFDNPASMAPAKMSTLSILTIWAIVFTAGRFYVKIRRLSLGDYFALLALLASIAVLGIMSTNTGLDRHKWDIPVCFYDGWFAKSLFLRALLPNLGSFFAKASILLLFQQLFTVHETMRYAIWAGQTFNLLLYASGIPFAIYYFTPRIGETWSTSWDRHTTKPLIYWNIQSALIIVLDVYILILPMPHVWKLNLPLRRRLPTIAVFSLAILGIVASITNFVERVYVSSSMDQTWSAAILSFTSAVELNVAIIVSSGPGFASFMRCHVPALSSVAGSLFNISKRIRGSSEEALAEKKGNNANPDKADNDAVPDKAPRPGMVQYDSLNSCLRYYGVSGSYMIKTGVTVDEERDIGNDDNGIVRTISVEQLVTAASVERGADRGHS